MTMEEMKKTKSTFHLIAGISLAIATLPFLFYFFYFHNGLSPNDQNWANFGTFVGGIITSVFSFTSFILVLYMYSRSIEDKRADEKTTLFFKHLDLIENCRSAITVSLDDARLQGQEVFSAFSGLVAAFSMIPRLPISPRKQIELT